MNIRAIHSLQDGLLLLLRCVLVPNGNMLGNKGAANDLG